MQREGFVHHGIELRFGGRGHRIDLSALTGGRAITVYAQHEVIKDLVAARLARGGADPLRRRRTSACAISTPTRPTIALPRRTARAHELACDFIAGCDGFHGVCRPAIPARRAQRVHARLSVRLARHPRRRRRRRRGADLRVPRARLRAASARARPQIQRLYLQCDPERRHRRTGPTSASGSELHARLATDDGWTLAEGPILQKGIIAMRSFVVEPMQHGRLFLAGDAAHIVPPTGAKGLNLAVADVRVLTRGARRVLRVRRDGRCSSAIRETCLRRVWRAEHFSWWMTSMLHRFPGEDAVPAAPAALAARLRRELARGGDQRSRRITSACRSNEHWIRSRGAKHAAHHNRRKENNP